MLILTGNDIERLLMGREREVLGAVRKAYEAQAQKKTSLPHSVFLRFPENDKSRIIALPAYLGGDFRVAGIKWVSSFPGNLNNGLERASAVMILNSVVTGHPEVIMEASIINAKRTAASAALAAERLIGDAEIDRAGIIGCGPINFETVRFLTTVLPSIRSLLIYDLHNERATRFKVGCHEFVNEIEIANDLRSVLKGARLLSFATTAGSPYVLNPSDLADGAVVLHISLRDLSPDVILSAFNVVDDAEHVSRERTSIHLTEELQGNRDFVDCSIGDLLMGRWTGRPQTKRLTIFNPFGLGILDIAVGHYVYESAKREGLGLSIESFGPRPWIQRALTKEDSH